MIYTQFTLFLANKPGSLAEATHILRSAKVNLEGISVAESPDISMVQLIVSDAIKARAALAAADIAFTEQDVCVLFLANKPGALAAVAERLAKQKVNINYLYATTPPPGQGGSCCVVISADNLGAVEALYTMPGE